MKKRVCECEREREREREKEGRGRYWKLEKNDLRGDSAKSDGIVHVSLVIRGVFVPDKS